MRKSPLMILLSAVLAGVLLAGCGSGPTLPTLDLYGSSLSGTVEYVDGQSCRVEVTEGDSHYSTETVIQVTYTTLKGKDTLAVGDKVHFEYDYVKNVSDYNGMPHITIEQVKVD